MTKLSTTPDWVSSGRARHHQREQGDRGQVLHARAPNRPCGRSSSTPMKIAKMPTWPSDSPRYSPPSDSTTPISRPPTQRAAETAHAAEHHDGEGHQHEAAADLRVDVVGRQQEAGRRAQAGQADAEAHGIDMLDVDAHQLGALLFLGHRADGAAEVGALTDPAAAAPTPPARRRRRSAWAARSWPGRWRPWPACRTSRWCACRVLKNSSARFSITMARPSVTSRMFSSLPWLARLMTTALQRVAEREHAGHHAAAAPGRDRCPSCSLSRYTPYSASISAAPWAKLMMCSTP